MRRYFLYISGRLFLLSMPAFQIFFSFHNLFLNQPYQRKKQGVHQHTIQARQLESVEQARKADALFPTRDHTRAFEIEDSGDIILFQSYGFSVFPQVIRNLFKIDFFHTLLINSCTSQNSLTRAEKQGIKNCLKRQFAL